MSILSPYETIYSAEWEIQHFNVKFLLRNVVVNAIVINQTNLRDEYFFLKELVNIFVICQINDLSTNVY